MEATSKIQNKAAVSTSKIAGKLPAKLPGKIAGKIAAKPKALGLRPAAPAVPAGPQRLFKVGETAVYAHHGVAMIKRIDERMVDGKKKSFYAIQVMENMSTIMVPTDSAAAAGLREIISDKDVKRVYNILKKRDVKISNTTWNRRCREYMDKIRTGSVYEIAEVLRNLFMLRHNKDLSFGERQMLDRAKGRLVKEISLAKQQTEEAIEQEIQTIFAS